MKKVFAQALLLIALFLASWFAFQQIDWMKIFHVEQATKKTEEKLGDLFWDLIQKTEKVNHNKFVERSLDSLVSRICTANDIARENIKIHVIEKDDVNAFAFPGGHLIIYTGLILSAENEAELCGVICHEMAHIERNHVMKKMVKELGLSVLISMTSGNSGSELPRKAVSMLSSSAFDRKLEHEADQFAVDYLIKAQIPTEPFAEFLYKLAEKDNAINGYLSWIGTHPEPKERAEFILDYGKGKPEKAESILSKGNWDKIQDELKNE
ncbi:MAG: M48 family metallopeptidase [Saprospiraceae bacterium]